ncbi:polysaccharide deacetylase family protein [Flavobacterium wongokense]|uniref:polysaccharide deacetylase family protein n=1 Tax=Flavobacterium wongokense TaxID=2910674 RepID=UPI001F16A3EF|nr:polysaccharide deacetylase family protein [Flavobacterium sp. WG47]MCF6131783.1 polysaccharide deacetylase family protein [Flavobacterium sp. WG47]
MGFWVKTNRFVKWVFPNYVWDIPNHGNKVFLSFDDGPTPEVTEWTLEQLQKFDAKATFFCIGNNIEKHPEILKKIVEAGHAIGNHTFDHLKGWNTPNDNYIKNALDCQSLLTNRKLGSEKLFRPPYGKIRPAQSKKLRRLGYKIIMWDVISYDFDAQTSNEQCLENVLKNVQSGSIIVFHDSVKAEHNLKYALPRTLEFLKNKGYICASIVLG